SVLVQRRKASPKKDGCPDYDPGEVRKSRTADGVLADDVYQRPLGDSELIVVCDFGVGRANLKKPMIDSPQLQSWLSRFRRDDMYSLAVEGLTDCVGAQGANKALKRSRAEAVFGLLDPATRGRSFVVETGGASRFAFGNNSPEGRASNRGAIMLIRSSADFSPEDIPGKTRTDGQILDHARTVWRNNSSRADDDWTFYGSLTMLSKSGTDDRYIDGFTWTKYGADAASGTMKHLRAEVLRVVDPNAEDEANFKALTRLSIGIEQGLAYAATAATFSSGGSTALPKCHKAILRFLKYQLKDNSKSIYTTWQDAYVQQHGGGKLGWSTPC
ncbi:MAG: hypothetical protein WA912_02005, partial [Ornithinimicrobium sp.]